MVCRGIHGVLVLGQCGGIVGTYHIYTTNLLVLMVCIVLYKH